MSSARCVQSGGSESTMRLKSSASATGGTIVRAYNRRVIATTDYERLREAVGLVDRSARGKLRLTGAEAADYLQGQITNDVLALAPGTGCYAALLSHKGKMLTDMRVLRGEDFVWVDAEPEALPALVRNASMYSIGRDVRHEDVSGAYSILSLVGPESRAALDEAPP